jgi:hypothetical protein
MKCNSAQSILLLPVLVKRLLDEKHTLTHARLLTEMPCQLQHYNQFPSNRNETWLFQ